MQNTKYFSPNILQHAKEGDAGYDLVASSNPEFGGLVSSVLNEGPVTIIHSLDYIEYDTGVIFDPPSPDLAILILPRSSLTKQNLFLKNSVGLIDSGYRGTVKVRFAYQFQPQDFVVVPEHNGLDAPLIVAGRINENKIYRKGDRIAQAILVRVINGDTLERVDDPELLSKSVRGAGGFGSSGV